MQHTNDSLHLRKLARLLLDTHSGSDIVLSMRVWTAASADNFLVELRDAKISKITSATVVAAAD